MPQDPPPSLQASDGGTHKAWILGGMALSLTVSALFLLRRNWKGAKIGAGLAAAFVEKWREIRMAAQVKAKLAEAAGAGTGNGSPLRPAPSRGRA